MKKIFFALPLVLLLAAGCNSQVSQNNTQQGSQTGTQNQTGMQNQNPPPAPDQQAASVTISRLKPSAAKAGTTVTITGTGFTATGNQIMFGDPTGRHHIDGSADNVISTANSSDGKSLSFTVPASGPSGVLCDAQNHCIAISAILRQPGNYKVSVSNKNGTSNVVEFTLQ